MKPTRLSLVFFAMYTAVCAAAARPPNIVLIVADDLGGQHDLAGQHAERMQELVNAWQAWDADVNRSAQQHVE